MTITNNAKLIRRDILTRLSKVVLYNKNWDEADRIPISMRPKTSNHVRCCIYRDRAVIKHKIMAMLGFDSNNEADELKSLGSYLRESLQGQSTNNEILSVVDEACSACQKNNYVVTNMCRGCVGRPCMLNCPKNAISFEGRKAQINADLCVNCGLCQKVCPFHAIIYSPVPCEEACPVNAIEKDATGKEKIDMEHCILCGKCMDACPFGAIVEKTHLFDVIQSVQNNKQTIAMVAPAIAGQFRESMEKITGSLIRLGFTDVYEVAMGADITSQTEAEEFYERAKAGKSMTTSCCPAYVNYIDKHIPELKPKVSNTKTPMEYTAEYLRNTYPAANLVFIGPCLGKKDEAIQSENVDYVLNFEEYGSWLIAQNIEISECQEYPIHENISQQARTYARTGGVSQAVAKEIPELEFKNVQFDGIDKRFTRQLKSALKQEKPALIEVMACENGCLGGCYSIVDPKLGRRQLETFVKQHATSEKTIH